MALAGVKGAIGGDAGDLLIGGDLVEQFGQHGRVADVAGGELGRTDFQCFLVNSDVDFAPDAPFGAAVLACSSGKQSPGLFSDPPSLKKNLGFRAIRELLPGTAFMPGSSGGWVEVSWALQGRSIVGSPPLFHVT